MTSEMQRESARGVRGVDVCPGLVAGRERGLAMSLGIVIPTLDAEEFLEPTLAGLGPLRAAGAKVVIVDGGSSDRTCAIAQEWGVDVRLAPRVGMYAALNDGFAALECRWLTWINCDDVIFSRTMIDRLDDAEAADVHYGAVDFIDASGRFVHSWQTAAPSRLLKLFQVGCSPLLQQGTIFRRLVFEKLGGFTESYRFVADADFWWRALEHGFVFKRLESPPVAAFRLHHNQLSQRHADVMQAEHRRMAQQHGAAGPLQWWSPSVLRFRLANSRRYLLRAIRSADLGGRMRCSRSYEVDSR